MVDAETVLGNGTGPVLVQAILQLYFYEIDRSDLKINLSDFSVRLPYVVSELKEQEVTKDTPKADTPTKGSTTAPVSVPETPVPVVKPGQELNLNNIAGDTKKSHGWGRMVFNVLVVVCCLGGLYLLVAHFCSNARTEEQESAPSPVSPEGGSLESTATFPKSSTTTSTQPKETKQEYEMTSTQSRDTKGSRDEENI